MPDDQIPPQNASTSAPLLCGDSTGGENDTQSAPEPGCTDVRVIADRFRWTGDGLGPAGAVILKQLKREGKIAIYERTRERDGKLEGYEVIKIRVKFSNGRYEAYPSANDFGPYARFVTTLARAEEVFREWTQP